MYIKALSSAISHSHRSQDNRQGCTEAGGLAELPSFMQDIKYIHAHSLPRCPLSGCQLSCPSCPSQALSGWLRGEQLEEEGVGQIC